MAITETKITKCIEPAFNPSLKGYKFNHTPTESECGGTILYIADYLTSKNRPDFETLFYNLKELESTFIEIINPTRKTLSVVVFIVTPAWIFISSISPFLVPYLKN